MLPELEGYDWQEAFAYAGEPSEYGSASVESVSPNCSTNGFTREDVAEIYGIQEGENDERPWRVYGKLNDGRYFYLEAGCCYTGWDCQAGGSAWVSSTRQGIIREGLTDEARKLFGLTEDNVGTIEVKESKEAGFMKITMDKKDKKEKKVKVTEEKVNPKKRPSNSILGLDIE